MLKKKLWYLMAATPLLLMLLGCAQKPQVLLTPMPLVPYPSDLLVYCHRLADIPEDMPLQLAMLIDLENAKLIADCYRRQRGIVDAIKRRN